MNKKFELKSRMYAFVMVVNLASSAMASPAGTRVVSHHLTPGAGPLGRHTGFIKTPPDLHSATTA